MPGETSHPSDHSDEAGGLECHSTCSLTVKHADLTINFSKENDFERKIIHVPLNILQKCCYLKIYIVTDM